MKKYIVILFLLVFSSAYAEDGFKKGFSGYLEAGVLGISSNDATLAIDQNEDIDGTSDSPDRYSAGFAFGSFMVKHMSSRDLGIYLGTPVESVQPEIAFGLIRNMGFANTDLAVIFKPFARAWENPYESKREDTDASTAGVKLTLSEIAGSPSRLELKMMGHNVDNDTLGRQYSELKRKGFEYELTYGYDIKTGAGMFRPYAKVKYDDRLGDAESSKGAGAGVILFKKYGKDLLIANASADYSGYDEENPYFDKTRKDINTTLYGKYKLQDPFGWEKKHFSFTAGVLTRESNIDFYDAVTYIGAVTFGIDF